MATERTRLVETLREDEFQTVAQLSAALQIDEATIAEHLQQLEQDGLPLQSASDCGFRLLEGITPIDAGNLVENWRKPHFLTRAKSRYWIPLIQPATGSADSKTTVSIFTAKHVSRNFRAQAVADVAETGGVPRIAI